MAKTLRFADIELAMHRLQEMRTKYHLGGTSTNIGTRQLLKLDPAAIATGGPASTTDKVTKRTIPFVKRGTARIAKKPKHKLCSTKRDEDIAKINDAEASQEGLTRFFREDSDHPSELTYWSTTEEEEMIPTQPKGKSWGGVKLDQLADMGLTVYHLFDVKTAKKAGTFAELIARKTPEEAAALLAAEMLLKKAEEGK